MKLKEPTLPEMLEMIADETNKDRKSKLQAYPGESTIIFKWRDPVAMMHKLKMSMEESERFYIAAYVYPGDKVRIMSRDMKNRKLRESFWIFLLGETYVKGLFEELGYRQVFQPPKTRKRIVKHIRNVKQTRRRTVRHIRRRQVRRTCRR